MTPEQDAQQQDQEIDAGLASLRYFDDADSPRWADHLEVVVVQTINGDGYGTAWRSLPFGLVFDGANQDTNEQEAEHQLETAAELLDQVQAATQNLEARG